MNGPLHDPDVRRAWILLADAAQTVATACRTTEPELWFADTIEDRQTAADRCGGCQLLKPCRQYAVLARERHGVWGAVDFQTRRIP